MWFKVDDQLAFHAKSIMAGNSAMGLWVRAGSWASAHLTNGFVPNHMANAMANANDIEQLVISGLWDETEGGYLFHDWSSFQPDAEAKKQRREEISNARSEAGKRGAQARWGHKNGDGNHGKSMANASDDYGKSMAPYPYPSPKESTSRPTRKHLQPDGWKPNNAHEAKGKELGVDVQTEAEKFSDWHASKGSKFVNWDRAFNNWLRKAAEFRPQPTTPKFNPWDPSNYDDNRRTS